MWIHIRMTYPWRDCNRLLIKAGISWDEIESSDYALNKKQQDLFEDVLSPEIVKSVHDSFPPDNLPSGWQRILGDRYGRLIEQGHADRKSRRRS